MTVIVNVDTLAHPVSILVVVYDIVSVPAATPVTRPATTVATLVLDELHVPSAVASVSSVVAPAHTVVAPTIGELAGIALIVTVALPCALQPQLLFALK